jgi:hypothetical protein
VTATSVSLDLRRQRVAHTLGPISLAHSTVYAALLVVWLIPGLHQEEMVFGLIHGVAWIAMSLVCVTLASRRLLPVRTATAVAILGGIGPFVGTYEFMRLRHEDGAHVGSNQ